MPSPVIDNPWLRGIAAFVLPFVFFVFLALTVFGLSMLFGWGGKPKTKDSRE